MESINKAYEQSLTPASTWELWRWFLLEPKRLEELEERLSQKEVRKLFLKTYVKTIPFFIGLWLLLTACIACLDLPNYFPNEYKEVFLQEWQTSDIFLQHWWQLLESTWIALAFVLTLGLAAGSVLRLAEGLVVGLAFGLAFGLDGGLANGLAGGLAFGLAVGLATGSAFGPAVALAFGLARSFAVGLAFGLAFGLAYGLTYGLGCGLAFIIFFYASQFRLWFWPFYYLNLSPQDFQQNPYLKDATIQFPLHNTDKQLIKLAKRQPIAAIYFINFLLEHRPFQHKLAMKLSHSVQGGLWHRQHFQNNNAFDADLLTAPIILEQLIAFHPKPNWKKALQALRNQLTDYQQQIDARIRVRTFTKFQTALDNFKQQNLIADKQWNHHYFDAINKWEKEAKELAIVLQQEAAKTIENPYQRKALLPGENEAVFLGRKALYNELGITIRTSKHLPLFLIQGQRRVGKTSLLNFLQNLLGNRFLIVRMDLQSTEDCLDIPCWMNSLRQKFNLTLGLEADDWQATDNWLQSWDALSKYLIAQSNGKDYKVIIAMDEYEGLHEKGLQYDPIQGGHLLGAIRSFSQNQNQVAFLFVGAALFSELDQPNWGNYFVHNIRLKVDYLNEADTQQLLCQPTDTFKLEYKDELPAKIRHLTQGHPALLQMIGRELVERANQQSRRFVDAQDLNQILDQRILHEDNGVFAPFWNQFCYEAYMKSTVLAIIRQQPITDKVALQKLLRHEFIVSENGQYKMRVPLFEQWVRKFDISFLE